MKNLYAEIELNDEQYESWKNGDLKLNGMLKDENNQIKAHLNADVVDKDSDNKSGFEWLIGIGIVAVGCVANFTISKIKQHKAKAFYTSLDEYNKKVQDGTLDYETIENLLEKLKKITDKNKKLKIEMSSEELYVLVNTIYNVTKKMIENSEDGQIKIDEPQSETAVILDIEKYLRIQMDLHKKSA